MAGNNETGARGARLGDERFHFADGAQLDVDVSGAIEKTPEQRPPRRGAEPVDSAFRRMSRGDDKRSVQSRPRSLGFLQAIRQRIEA